ncbi:MAG TPA: HAD family hydrolase [Paracoccus sp. (in: a-proteobacteria)]|nr:HAD family hydrolase [Paracoccus sp. (in: a-proteobacteria)]
MLTIGFDADDTLWENETFFHLTQDDFVALLAGHADPDTIRERLFATEVRNLELYGYGIKGFTLSMIQTALELTGGDLPGASVARLLDLGQQMLRHPVRLLPHVETTLAALREHRLVLITKGDVLDQERKIAASGLATLFDRIEIVQHKTPQAYARILDRARVRPADFMMIGNSMQSDILPVLELGGHAALVPQQLAWAHEHADDPDDPRFARLESLADLPALVGRVQSSGTAV